MPRGQTPGSQGPKGTGAFFLFAGVRVCVCFIYRAQGFDRARQVCGRSACSPTRFQTWVCAKSRAMLVRGGWRRRSGGIAQAMNFENRDFLKSAFEKGDPKKKSTNKH